MPADESLIGTTLSERYEIKTLLGSGGMSVVYEGWHTYMKRPVAVKVLRANLVTDDVSVKRFQQEAQAAGALSHPNVVGVRDFGFTPDGLPFLIMDYVEGTSLARMLDERGHVPIALTVEIFKQLCDGLGHAHEHGIIHRDLKPSNIMICSLKDGHVVAKIVDFGLVKLMPEAGFEQQQLTLKGEVFGTTLYMSPEQCTGKQLDPRTDLYSLGCVLYEAIAGLPPFVGDNERDTMHKQIIELPKPVRTVRTDLKIPAELEMIVLKALEKKRENRYQTAAEMKADLERVQVPDASGAHAARGFGGVMSSARMAIAKRPVWLPVVAFGALMCFGMFFLFPGSVHERANGPGGAITPDEAVWKVHEQRADKLYEKGEFEQAEGQYKDAVRAAESLKNQEKYLLVSLRKLSDCLYTQEKFAEAEKIDSRVRTVRDQVLMRRNGGTVAVPEADTTKGGQGTSKAAVSDKLARLAQLCHSNGQCDKAVQLMKSSLLISEKLYGSSAPETAERKNDLASLYLALGEYEKAEPLFKELMNDAESLSQTRNEVVEKSKRNYAKLLRETKRSDQADDLETRSKTAG